MPPALILQLVQFALPELLKVIPGAVTDIEKLIAEFKAGNNPDWSILDKYQKDFKTAFPHADIGNTD